MSFGNGPWKEGRSGGASLCYISPDPETLRWVMEHHAKVGIRATVAGVVAADLERLARERNWDLASLAGSLGGHRPLEERPSERGLVHGPDFSAEAGAGSWLYQVTGRSGEIAGPGVVEAQALPSHVGMSEMDGLMERINRVVEVGAWAIWRLDEVTLQAMRPNAHRALLAWLGEHHGRIWCAPVRDIAAWRP